MSHKLNFLNTDKSLLRFLLILFFFAPPAIAWGQVDLVSWNTHTAAPPPEVENITVNQLVLGGGVTVENNDWSGFRIGNLHNGVNSNINYSKYLEFRITPDEDYKIVLSQFKLRYNSPNNDNGPNTLQVRYSTDPAFPSDGTLLGSTQTLVKGSDQDIALSFPANYTVEQTLYVRVYIYGSVSIYYTDFYIRNTLYSSNPTPGPTLTGTVLSALPPVAVNDNESTAEDTPADFDILANDTYSTLTNINIEQDPEHGNIEVNGTTDVTYTPDNGYNGSDSFTYTITDENGTSTEATVNITIIEPTPPTAVADIVSTIKNHSINSINVLANDSPGSGAFDHVTKVSEPSHGTATINPDNKTFSYIPTTDYSGSDSFQYNVTNVQGLTSNTVTVTVNVNSTENLAIWNNTDFTPTIVNNISASNITIAGSGLTLTHKSNSATEDFFEASNNWPSGSIDLTKYIEFTISPDAGYKIELDRFNFYYKSQGGQNFQVRYSKNNFASYTTMIGNTSVPGTWTSASNTFSSGSPILPGETLKIRIYAYNTYQVFQIKRYFDTTQPTDFSQTPRITGRVVSLNQADLQITHTVDNDEPVALDDVTFTITAKNNGDDNAQGVVVNDLLPTGLTYVSHSATNGGGTYNQTTGVWTIGNLDDEDEQTLTITATVQSTGNYTNTATISGDDDDPNLSNNSVSVSVDPYFPSADLEITSITIDDDEPSVGDNVTFTVNVRNNGIDAASGVVVSALLPNGYQYVSNIRSTGSYNNSTGDWTIGNMAVSASENIQITAKVLATGVYAFNAEINGAVDDPDENNNTNDEDVTLENVVDLEIEKTYPGEYPEGPVYDEAITFVLTATNNSTTTTATDVVVTDVLEDGFGFGSIPPEYLGQYTYDPETRIITWNVGSLLPEEEKEFEIIVNIRATLEHENTATIKGGQPDDIPGNNSSTVSVSAVIDVTDLQVKQRACTEDEIDCSIDFDPDVTYEPPGAGIGDTVTFSIGARNASNESVGQVIVTDILGNGFEYVASSAIVPPGTSFDPETGIWDIGDMDALDELVLTFQATINEWDPNFGVSYLNIAEITSDVVADELPVNNASYVILAPTDEQLPCDVNAEEPVFEETFGSGAATYAGELSEISEGSTNLEYFEPPALPAVYGVDPPTYVYDGSYVIGHTAKEAFDPWQDIPDHTGLSDGYYMIVNAYEEPSEFFRIRIQEEFCANTRYTVSFWATTVNSQGDYDTCGGEGGLILPEIGYFIQNQDKKILGSGTSGEIPYNDYEEWEDDYLIEHPEAHIYGKWIEYSFVITTSGSDDYMDLVLFNMAPGGCGNDLAIDDISVYACMTPPIDVNLEIGGDQLEVCGGEDVTMTVLYTDVNPDDGIDYVWPPASWNGNVDYQWQRSDDEVTWEDIPGETSDEYIIEDFAPEDQAYYRLLYAQEGNIGKESCRFPSEKLFPVFNATPVLNPIEPIGGVSYVCPVPDGTLQVTNDYDFLDPGGYEDWDDEEMEGHYAEWAIVNGTGSATINTIDDNNAEITAVTSGTVTVYYTVRSPQGFCSNYVEKVITVLDDCPTCVEEVQAPDTGGDPSPIGISTLESQMTGWPESVPNGFIVLESNDKGFVITRVANDAAITAPKEGMLVYNTADKCIKLYNGSEWHCIDQECDEVP